MSSSCMWRHHACDVIICGNFIRDAFEMTKDQVENNISQHLDKFACSYKDLLALMTSSLFSWRHNTKIFILKALTKSSCNRQKILLALFTKQFLDRVANLPLIPVQIGCKNNAVYIGVLQNFLAKYRCRPKKKFNHLSAGSSGTCHMVNQPFIIALRL